MKQSKKEMDNILVDEITTTNIIFWEWNTINDELSLSSKSHRYFKEFSHNKPNNIDDAIEDYLYHNFKKIMNDEIENALVTGMLKQVRYKIILSDETLTWILIDGNVVYNEKNEIVKIIGVVVDISESKKKCDESYEYSSFLQALIESIEEPIFYKDKNGIYQFCNQAYCDVLDLDKDMIIGHDVFNVTPRNLAEIFYKEDQKLIAEKGDQIFETKVLFTDGQLHDVVIYKKLFLDNFGEFKGIIGSLKDISDQKSIAKQAEKREMIKDLFLLISQNISNDSENVSVFDMLIKGLINIFDDANYGSVLENIDNERFRSISSIGYKNNSIENFEISIEDSIIYRLADGNLSQSEILRNINNIADIAFPEFALAVDGKEVNTIMYIPVKFGNDKQGIICLDSNNENGFTNFDLSIAEYVKMQVPILYQLYELNKERLEISRYDSLTGLVNRRYFTMLLDDRLALSKRNKAVCVLAMMDLDELKKINDEYGHHAGDEYIKAFGREITSCFRTTDIFSRIGGDEFCGIFSTKNPQKLIRKIEKFQKTFEVIQIEVDNIQFCGSFSFGLAQFPDDSNNIDGLMRIADKLMYENKKSRKQNRI
ncbi:MAG: diguanylate cyclase [Clostridiales bacterium]|nr:diguanylate cyclase [Clostridiales bacterium]